MLDCWWVQRPHESLYLQFLQARSRELGSAGRVRFLGQRADVPRLLLAAEIHCQPNTAPELFGIVFVEGFYAGLPVVTTGMGRGLEIVDEFCGRLVAPNDAKALWQLLRSLITNSGERANLAAGGSARAEQLCDPARQLTRLYNLLSQLVMHEAVI